jgi:hypothetical protein
LNIGQSAGVPEHYVLFDPSKSFANYRPQAIVYDGAPDGKNSVL